MAVTGVFNADFSQFFTAVTEANGKLDSLETNTTQASAAVKGLETNFGASSAKLRDLGGAAGTTAPQINSLSDSYKQFDGALAAVGVHIGPQVKALEDLTEAAGKSVSEVGALGTAGLVLGTGMAAWGLGRAIADFFELDKTIAAAAVSLGLFGDVAAETAGAQQDTINRAIAAGAKETISYTDAIKFNQDAMSKHVAQQKDWSAALADAQREVRTLTDAQKADIEIMQQAGASTEQITTKYTISATALKILAERQRDAATAVAEHTRESEKLARAKEAEAAALDKAYEKLMSDVKNAQGLAQMEADAAQMKAEADAKRLKTTTDLKNAIYESARASNEAAKWETAHVAEQQKIDAENEKLIGSYAAAGDAAAAGAELATTGAQATAGAYAGVTQQVNISADAIRGWLALMHYTNASNAILSENSLFTTQSQRDRLAGLSVPSFATGVENFGGGLAKVHGGELLVNLPGGTSVIPKGQAGGVTMSNVFNLVDSESNLARRVSELIMQSVRAGTQLGTT